LAKNPKFDLENNVKIEACCMITAKISSKGQITLPRKVRQALDVSPGERVTFTVEDRAVVLRALGVSGAKALAGVLHRYSRGRKSPRHVRAAVRKEVVRAAASEG
jgi:AbrB family looped-hinge helix DNA binding protein